MNGFDFVKKIRATQKTHPHRDDHHRGDGVQQAWTARVDCYIIAVHHRDPAEDRSLFRSCRPGRRPLHSRRGRLLLNLPQIAGSWWKPHRRSGACLALPCPARRADDRDAAAPTRPMWWLYGGKAVTQRSPR